jgi:hypothetical protein
MHNPAGRINRRRHDVLTVVGFALVVTVLVTLRQQPPPGLCVLGDAGARLAARIPPELASAYVDSTRLMLGFGSGALGSWQGLGEALAVGGQVYVRSTDYPTPQYYQLLQARRFQTNAFAYVPRGARARESLALRRGGRFRATWQELGRHYPDGALIAGFVQFRTLRTIAISRPATHGLPVLQNPAYYYTEPMESADHVWTYVVGLVARDQLPPPRSDDPLFLRLIARGIDGRLDTYALALRLAAPPDDASRTQDLRAISLGRITGDSVIEQGEVSVFPADRLAACNGAISTQPRVAE